LGHAIIGIVIMIFSSVGVTYPVFHFSRINSIFSLQSQEQNIYVCHEMWPNWLRLSYQVMFSFGHILLPSIFIVSQIPKKSTEICSKRLEHFTNASLYFSVLYVWYDVKAVEKSTPFIQSVRKQAEA